MELYFSPAAERRAAVSAEAVATARHSGDRRALTRALEARHFAVWHRIGPGQRLALADEMIRLSAEIDDAEILMRGQHLRLADLLELGRIVEVDDTIAAYARLAEELRPPSHRWGLGLCRAMRSLMNGHFDEAEALATAALAVGQSVQPETAANFYAAQIFFIRREQGRLAELEDALLGAVAAYPVVPAWRSALASLYCEVGRRDDAAREFERAASADFADIAEDGNWLGAVTVAGEVCAHLADRRRAAVLYDRLLPYRELVAVAGIAAACIGSVARVLGLLAGTLGRWDDAIRHFDRALAVHRSLGAPPLVLRTQQEYAAMLLAAADAGLDAAGRARALLDEAGAGARALGMGGVAARVEALRSGLGPAAPAVSSAAPAVASAEAASLAHIDVDATDNLFRRDDDYWTLAFEGRSCRLKDAKGLRFIAILLQEPNRGFHVSELVRDEIPAASDAVGGYRARLRDLSDELEEAERFNDPGRAARAQAEIDALTSELSRLVRVGQGGHELLRLRVTKAIKAAARKISAGHPALGHHLRTAIRTGSVCTYAPDPTKPVRWTVGT
jgi:tetratricopeptide (TPR) repeat protein